MTVPAIDQLLVLGPMLRYVDETSATVWVSTAEAAIVTVERTGRAWSAATFAVHGCHYALVVLDGLVPGSDAPYSVRVDDVIVWPRPGMPATAPRYNSPASSHGLVSSSSNFANGVPAPNNNEAPRAASTPR